MKQLRHVHKFGGSSLADANCFRRVAGIIQKYSAGQDLIVVSAAGKTTNRLIEIVELAKEGDNASSKMLEALAEYQTELVRELLDGFNQAEALELFDSDLRQLAELLENGLDQYQVNQILSFGEVWSARLLAGFLRSQDLPASWLDSRLFLSAEFGVQPVINVELSKQKLADLLEGRQQARVVITGFFAADSEGHTVTLGRNGSDYSATVTGQLADAVSTTIWSDVAGVFSADPRKVKDAVLLDRLSLDEAAELSRLGSPVLHARTLLPVQECRQKLSLRSSYTPDEGCTQILRRQHKLGAAKIVTSLDQACLIEMGISINEDFDQAYDELLSYLTRRFVAPICAYKNREKRLLRLVYTSEIVDSAFACLKDYQPQGGLTELTKQEGYSMVGLVGNGVTDNAEQCYRFYQLVAEQPLEFIQSCEQKLSLIAVMKEIYLEPLLKSLHISLFKQPKRVAVVVFGKGNIGKQWLSLYASEKASLEHNTGVELSLCGVFGSNSGVLNYDGLDPENVLDQLTEGAFIWEDLLYKLKHHPFDELVVLDITASETVSRYYPEFAQRRLHLITANKFAGAADSEFYNEVKQGFADHSCHWLYNATVGAGLPVQSSIKMLQDSGDKVQAVSGIFSGTLSWLFQNYSGEMKFSELVNQAWQQGLTEPNPKDDLSGMDVQRKLLILAREAGHDLEPKDVKLESLVPAALSELNAEQFMQQSHLLDEGISEAFKHAAKQDKVLRYVARFSAQGGAKVGLEALPKTHPFANLQPCDNVFAIETQWYRSNPLVIQGPGAGREVTAGAIQSDLTNICRLIAG